MRHFWALLYFDSSASIRGRRAAPRLDAGRCKKIPATHLSLSVDVRDYSYECLLWGAYPTSPKASFLRHLLRGNGPPEMTTPQGQHLRPQ